MGNDVSGQNASCTPGFHIPPFNVPTTAPGAGHPDQRGPPQRLGRDHGRRRARPQPRHDQRQPRARRRLRRRHRRPRIGSRAGSGADQGQPHPRSAPGRRPGVDPRDRPADARPQPPRARASIATASTDSATTRTPAPARRAPTPRASSSTRSGRRGCAPRSPATPTRTRPGRGGFSANGLEFVSMDDGPRALVEVRDSTFSGPPGDVIEQLALGTNARLRLRLTDVVATASTGFGGSGFGDTVIIPGNNGDCLIAASGGAGNVVDAAGPRQRADRLRQQRAHARLRGRQRRGADHRAAARPRRLADHRQPRRQPADRQPHRARAARASRSSARDLADSQGTASTPANLTVEELGSTAEARHRPRRRARSARPAACCLDGGQLAAAVAGYDVSARNAWWGDPGRPGPGRVVAAGGTLDAGSPLGSAPAGC